MYSYEDRIRAVHLYINLGKRGTATIRQLGYPTVKALKRWHSQYERGHDLPAGYLRLRPKYSAEEKREAVDHYGGAHVHSALTKEYEALMTTGERGWFHYPSEDGTFRPIMDSHLMYIRQMGLRTAEQSPDLRPSCVLIEPINCHYRV